MKLRDTILNEIATGCYRKVNKRLALKLAAALERGEEADLFLADRITKKLEARIEVAAARQFWRL